MYFVKYSFYFSSNVSFQKFFNKSDRFCYFLPNLQDQTCPFPKKQHEFTGKQNGKTWFFFFILLFSPPLLSLFFRNNAFCHPPLRFLCVFSIRFLFRLSSCFSRFFFNYICKYVKIYILIILYQNIDRIFFISLFFIFSILLSIFYNHNYNYNSYSLVSGSQVMTFYSIFLSYFFILLFPNYFTAFLLPLFLHLPHFHSSSINKEYSLLILSRHPVFLKPRQAAGEKGRKTERKKINKIKNQKSRRIAVKRADSRVVTSFEKR